MGTLELKQSTAITVLIGPFIDNTDGISALGGLTITRASVRLSKNAGNMAQKNEATNCTHDELGYYSCPIDATDTATLGRLELIVTFAGAMQVWHDYEVVTANYWDTKYGADYFDVEVADKTGYSLSAAGIDAIHDEIVDGTLTLRQAIMLIKASTAGESTGGATATLTFRDHADTKARLTVTVDPNGNRTNVVTDTT